MAVPGLFDETLSSTGLFDVSVSPSGMFDRALISVSSGALFSSITGHVTIAGTLKGTAVLSASVAGHASYSDTIKGAGKLASAVAGHATESGTLKGSTFLSSSIVKQATVSSGGQLSTHLLGSISGHPTITGLLKGVGSIFSSIVHHASVGSLLQEFEAFGSTIFGQASVNGSLKAKGRLVSLILGQGSINAVPHLTVVVSTPLSASIRGRSQVLCLPIFTAWVAPPSGAINSTTGQFKGATVQTAFVGCNMSPVNQSDLIQVIGRGGKIIWRIDYQGNAEYNPVNYTAGAILGRFFGSNIKEVLGLLTQQDLISVYNNGNCIWRVDNLGNVYRYTS